MSEQVMVKLDDFEQRLLVKTLADGRNQVIKNGGPTEDIDELLLKVIDAPPVKQRKKEVRETR